MKTYKKNIVIADDSPIFAEGLNVLVDSWPDYKIIEVCKNGMELVESTVLSIADIALVDIEMPVMNGFEAARLVNKKQPNLPMIALTMYQEQAYLKDIIFAGFKAFIYKPEVPTKLFEVINQVLNNKYIFPKNLKLN